MTSAAPRRTTRPARSSTSSSAPASPRKSKRGRGNTTVVFAYGSNLDLAQMLRRCGPVEVLGAAILPDYRLAFSGWSARWQGAVATVIAEAGAAVPGVLYRLDADALLLLDLYEGCPHVYQRSAVEVLGPTAHRLTVQTYQLVVRREGAPSDEYLNVLKRAYRAWGFDHSKRFRNLLGRS